jgi:Peptidase family M48
VLFASLLFPVALIAQTTSKSCPAPPAILNSTQPNIFSEQQEQWLGDAMADMIESQSRPVQDPAENEYLGRIIKRLLAALPPTSIQFRIILVDSPEVNGFSLAGGRVYLTRKLVANANSEDEVATVIAHEMGHILSHQFATETTADFKRLLGVTSVTDKADIYAKFQRLVDARMTDKHPSRDGNSDQGQDEADVVAVYAAAAVGYRPQAYSEFWDRMFFVEGKVGGTLSDFFGTTKPESKRLRAILKLVNALPAGCGATEPGASPDFDRWHALVVANQPASIGLSAKPFSEVALNPPLRMDLERIRFSRDGKYILAQDESSISVLTRDPYQQVFRFDAEKALPAEFTPDSQRIVFHTPGLHTEEWSIAGQKLLSSHEPVARNECVQSKISPDGRTLFCFSLREETSDVTVDLTALDVIKGDVVYDLQNRVPVSLGRALKNDVGSYAFVGNDKVIGKVTDSETNIYSYPDGKKLQSVPFRVDDFESVTSGSFVLTQSLGDYSVAVGDIAAGKFIAASSSPSMDVWNGWLLNENADGSALLHKIGDNTIPDQNITLPVSPLSDRVFATVSADRRMLAVSSRTRGAVWNLQTGEQVFLARGFRSAIFAPDDSLFIEFPKLGKQERGIHHIVFSPTTSGSPVAYKEEDSNHLYGGEGVQGINVAGDKLYLSSDDNRTMVYALSTGTQLRQFFGYVIALDPATGRICIVNRRDEAIVYDTDGKQLADFYMGSPLRFATFPPNSPTPGGRILLLTADQKIGTMEIPAAPSSN